MDLKKIIGVAEDSGVIGKVLKSSTPVVEKRTFGKSRIAIGLGALAAVLGYISQHI